MKKVIICLITCLSCTFFISAQDDIYSKTSIKAIIDKVNDYQFANPWRAFDDSWIRGTYYTGVMACYQATGDKKLLDQCNSLGDSLQWKIPKLQPGQRPGGTNMFTVGQTWLESYMVKKKKYKIKFMIDYLENPTLKNPITEPLSWYYESERRFVDGSFTGPPALAMLYTVTKDDKYLQWMDAIFWEVYGSLYDLEENLYYRDHRFFPDCIEQRKNDPEWKGNHQVTASGKKVIWSRGNGWVFAGIARILKYLPKDHASYVRYETVFKKMAQSLKSRQSEEGFWYPNLADPNDVPLKETSGTAFFIYGLAYGINNGILDKTEYLPVVRKGWESLYTAVSEEGKVQWGQVIGDRPVILKEEDSHEFVSGTFLLAASEMYKLAK